MNYIGAIYTTRKIRIKYEKIIKLKYLDIIFIYSKNNYIFIFNTSYKY